MSRWIANWINQAQLGSCSSLFRFSESSVSAKNRFLSENSLRRGQRLNLNQQGKHNWAWEWLLSKQAFRKYLISSQTSPRRGSLLAGEKKKREVLPFEIKRLRGCFWWQTHHQNIPFLVWSFVIFHVIFVYALFMDLRVGFPIGIIMMIRTR